MINAISPITTDVERPRFAHDAAHLNRWMNGIANDYPGLASVREIGRSLDDRPILALMVGGRGSDKATVPHISDVHVGGLHGRELMPPDALMHGVEELLRSEHFRQSVMKNGIALIPCANPDGRTRVLRGLEKPMAVADRYRYLDTWHRGNARGVDLNRNFPSGWQKLPNHTPGHPNMKGDSPLSEPETGAIAAFIAEVKPSAVVDWHSPGNVIYPTADTALSDAIAAATGLALHARINASAEQNGGTLKNWASENGAAAATVELGYTHHGSNEYFPEAVRQVKQGIIATRRFTAGM